MPFMYLESKFLSKNDSLFCFQKKRKMALFATENHYGITFWNVRTVLM